MKAIGYTQTGPIDRDGALIDFECETPDARGHDLLIQVQAISVNPIDTKIRMRRAPEEGLPAILGWDACGIVKNVGDKVEHFQVGEWVYYAGALNRPGTNSEFHLVDERIVGRKPRTLSQAESAALPLTGLTAYEMLFDRLQVQSKVPGASNSILIIGGAGGVGSMAIQLLRAKTDLTVIATASRDETKAWVKDLGAHHVIDHSQNLGRQLDEIGQSQPGFVFSTTHTQDYLDQIADLLAPQGRLGLIDDLDAVNIMPFKLKSISIHWEMMYTRSSFQTPDLARQRDILNEVSELADAGKLQSTLTKTLGKINAANLITAHTLLESGKMRGKIVLEGF